MTSSPGTRRWQQVEALFHAVVELPPDSRLAFLTEKCGTDTELRRQIESLLKFDDTPVSSLQQPVIQEAQQVIQAREREVLTAGTHLGHYEVISLLGSGGMGEVYLALDSRLRRKVAVKTLLPQRTHDERSLVRFEQEARAASALNHPNILTIFEFAEIDNMHCIVSEFVDGITLRKKLQEQKFDTLEAIDISLQIANALAAAHASGIVHRDIKPENAIVRKDGIVKVLDFGIAKLLERQETEERSTLASATMMTFNTQRGVVIGTAAYMSPEQARGIPIDARSDIFGLGAVMYEMLAGRPAFEGDSRSDIISSILKVDPPELPVVAPQIPPELARIVNKALAKDRDQRYQKVTELIADLRTLKDELEFNAKLGRTPGSSSRIRAASSGQLVQTPAKPGGITDLAARVAFRQTTWTHKALPLGVVLVLALAVGIAYVAKMRTSHAGSPQHHRLAILPFTNLKPDAQTDFLGFSLADAVITKVGYVSALTVRPSSSVAHYRNQEVDPAKAGKDLNVDTLLTGSYLKDGEDLRINTQLVDVNTDRILWRDQIDVKYDKLLTVQDRVSQQIIRGLELNLSPAEAKNLQPENAVNNLAYEYYLRGVDFYALGDFPAAIRMLERSVSLDPNYALTWTHLGRAYTTNASLQFGGREQYRKAQAAYEKALALNPALIEPRIYMANLLTDTGRVEQAVPLLRAALETNPNNAEAHWELGYAYRFAGMLQESVAEAERSRQLDPQVKLNSSCINSYLYVGDYAKFLSSLPDNNSAYILFYRGLGEYYEKNFSQASSDFDRAYKLDPNLLQAQVGKALSYAVAGQKTQGIELLKNSEKSISEHGVTDAEGIYKVAQGYAVLGDTASALRVLKLSINGGFVPYAYFSSDPLLENIRKAPEFTQLLSDARQRSEHFKALFFRQ